MNTQEAFKTVTFRVVGIRPILMHNGILADPSSKPAKELSVELKKKPKDYEKIGDLEWDGSLYWSKDLGYYMPSDNIEAAMIKSASRMKKKALFAAGLLVNAEVGVPIECDLPKDKSKAVADPRFRLTKGVVVQRNRVMRTRPLIPTGWKMEITFQYDKSANLSEGWVSRRNTCERSRNRWGGGNETQITNPRRSCPDQVRIGRG